ncbi:MAG: adenosylmethionine decarboxylase [Myxococcales bacterium]|nr:adenosylmethionine decarboxylase [Myxococcales bacterium]
MVEVSPTDARRPPPSTFGRHLLAELHGCDPAVLDDVDAVDRVMRDAAHATGARVVTTAIHRFAPQGVTGVVVIEESHLSIHTWPEHGYAAIDVYTCGDCDPEAALPVAAAGLGATAHEVMFVERGRPGQQPGMRVRFHRAD